MTRLVLQGIEQRYADQRALCALDLEVAPGQFLVLVGPSGCGKSTLLRVIAGLQAPSAGRVYFDGDDVTDWSPARRDVAMVFQSYALYPHLDVRANLGFGLRMRGVGKAEIARRVVDIAERLGLQALLGRRPSQLSGGQRQRVALGRALVRQPRVFLLDEPLSNLDAKLRGEMRAELARLHRAFGVTTVYVTHDQEEAMTLGQRVAVLRDGGMLEQCDAPLTVYRRPATTFVAEFVGVPRINFFDAEVVPGPEPSLRGPGLSFPLPAGALRESAGSPSRVRRVVVGLRPDALRAAGSTDPVLATVRVEIVETLGPSRLLHARGVDDAVVRVQWPIESAVAVGHELRLTATPAALHLFDPETGARLT